MLRTITMPDGSPCTAFHASLMMNQRGPFRGWTKEDAFGAFDKATSVLADKPGRFALWRCAVAAEIPGGLAGHDRDGVWLILFMKFFALVLQTFPGAQGITFLFDRKAEVEDPAHAAYSKVTQAIGRDFPDVFLDGMTFVDDDAHSGVQAADLLLYEWRKRLSVLKLNPERIGKRPWLQRMREARPDGAFVQFDVARHIAELKAQVDNAIRVKRMLFGDEISRD